jgi:hypothetical protein
MTSETCERRLRAIRKSETRGRPHLCDVEQAGDAGEDVLADGSVGGDEVGEAAALDELGEQGRYGLGHGVGEGIALVLDDALER